MSTGFQLQSILGYFPKLHAFSIFNAAIMQTGRNNVEVDVQPQFMAMIVEKAS